VLVVGLGLVGGSLAKALRRAGYRVSGVDRPAVLRQARAAGAVHAVFEDLASALGTADLVVLATPPRATLRLLDQVERLAPASLVVTDCASVKRGVAAKAQRLGFHRFVGGHPIAGTEGRGFESSRADLFAGRSWALTPEGAEPRAVALVRRMVKDVGARPVVLAASEHDRVLAFLSHLPQVAAWALYQAAARDRSTRRHLDLAGPGFRDMTRLHRSPRPLWREILGENRDELARALGAFARALRASARP